MESIKSYDYSKLSPGKLEAEFEKFIKECTWHAPGEGKNNCFINSTRYNLGDSQMGYLTLSSADMRDIIVSMAADVEDTAKFGLLNDKIYDVDQALDGLRKEGTPFDVGFGACANSIFLGKPVFILCAGIAGEKLGKPANGLVIGAAPKKRKVEERKDEAYCLTSELIDLYDTQNDNKKLETKLLEYACMGKDSVFFVYTQGHFQPMHTDVETRRDGIARFLGFKALGTLKQSLGQPLSENKLHHKGETLTEAETIMRKTLEKKRPVSIYNQDNINNSGVDITTSKDINRV